MRISIDEPEIEKVEKTEASLEREAVKKTFKGEMKKLSGMSFGEKVNYIWSYYKIPIIGSIVGIVLVCYIISFVSNRKTVMLMGVVLNDTGTNVNAVSLELSEYMGLTDKQEVQLLDGVFLSANSYGTQLTHNMSGSTQLLSYVMAKELDFVLCDEDGLSYMKENELCRDIPEYLTDEQKVAFKDRLVMTEGYEMPIAIDLTETQLVKELGLHQEKTYLVIVDIAGHREEILSFIRYTTEKL